MSSFPADFTREGGHLLKPANWIARCDSISGKDHLAVTNVHMFRPNGGGGELGRGVDGLADDVEQPLVVVPNDLRERCYEPGGR